AYVLPGATFLGIDLAPTPVERGRQCIAELGLTNVELRCGDATNPPTDLASFDYIVVHGLYSWVPPLVRERVLAVARDHLAPNGVVYVSYNTYPGCHVREMIRGMMRYHTRAMTEPRHRIDQARAVVKFVADGQVAPGAYAAVLREELNRAAYAEDEALLFHDDLAEVSDPVWFHESIDHAAHQGLRFLAEASYHSSDVGHLPEKARDTLLALRQADVVQAEQYLDFLTCRRFRRTLLCRQDVAVRPDADPGRVRGMAACCAARPEGVPGLAPAVLVTFREPDGGGRMTAGLPCAKAAVLHLGECYPRGLRFEELLIAASARVGRAPSDSDREALAETLLTAFAGGMAELLVDPLQFAREAGPRPEASAIARRPVRAGDQMLTNLRHERVKVDRPVARQLLLLMDGTRDFTALTDELTKWAASQPAVLAPATAVQIGPELEALARLALINETTNNLPRR